MKPSVYIETSIPSYLTAWPNRDLAAAAWQQITREWWQDHRTQFDLFLSELVIAETSRGDAVAAQLRLSAIDGIPELVIDDEVAALARRIVGEHGMPDKALADALHVATAAVHQMDYLLTWNCRHINNATTKPAIRSIRAMAGYRSPETCTPQELLPQE